jgi:hypothetical protein
MNHSKNLNSSTKKATNAPAQTEKQYPQSNNLCSQLKNLLFCPSLNILALKGLKISDLTTISVKASVKIIANKK